MNDKLLCIIPAKSHSSRLPEKNIIRLYGRPMIAYTIEAALKSKLFDEICVSTESEKIAEIARKYGATAPCKRPQKLTGPAAGVPEVCLHMIEHLEKKDRFFKTVCVLLPTSPLRTYEDIRKACQLFISKKALFLMGITQYSYEPFEALVEDNNGYLKPYWGNKYSIKRQNRPQLFVDSGAIYFVDIDAFKKEKTFYGSSLIGYPMPPERSVDVDTLFDLKIAECLFRKAKK